MHQVCCISINSNRLGHLWRREGVTKTVMVFGQPGLNSYSDMLDKHKTRSCSWIQMKASSILNLINMLWAADLHVPLINNSVGGGKAHC